MFFLRSFLKIDKFSDKLIVAKSVKSCLNITSSKGMVVGVLLNFALNHGEGELYCNWGWDTRWWWWGRAYCFNIYIFRLLNVKGYFINKTPPYVFRFQ